MNYMFPSMLLLYVMYVIPYDMILMVLMETGLGLAIVSRIVSMMGGRVFVESHLVSTPLPSHCPTLSALTPPFL